MSARLDMGPPAVTARLREAARATDLGTARRLHPKIDLSPSAVTARLRRASDLRDLCLALAATNASRR